MPRKRKKPVKPQGQLWTGQWWDGRKWRPILILKRARKWATVVITKASGPVSTRKRVAVVSYPYTRAPLQAEQATPDKVAASMLRSGQEHGFQQPWLERVLDAIRKRKPYLALMPGGKAKRSDAYDPYEEVSENGE